MGAESGIGLILCQNGLILHQNGFLVITNDNLLEEGECYRQHLVPYIELTGFYPISDNCIREKTFWLRGRAMDF